MTFYGFVKMDWEDIIIEVEKPGRYLGGEVNSPRRRVFDRLNVALAFPDSYEVGMSHLGMQILYGILNDLPGVAVDRCYAPWIDLEALLRRRCLPLAGLETRRPLADFDLVGFSLQYELSYTNLLNMLDLGGISLRRARRKENEPLVIAGGPGAFNPVPLADFVDAFVIGEGEEVIGEICRVLLAGKEAKICRTEMLLRLSELEGLYLPGITPMDRPVKKRIVADLEQVFFPEAPLVPLIRTIHDRVVAEIARGCTRGCRFCQAGMVWRPVRERGLPKLLDICDRMLGATGYDELSLLSLSAGDYTRIEELMARLMGRYADRRIALALPSLRVETLSPSMVEQIKRVRKTSFTLAPEAGTQRMREIINKGNTDEDLLSCAAEVFKAGWKALKLYFMIGLPKERREDLEGIVDLSNRVARAKGSRGQVTVSLSAFVPKPHTPFQWERQISRAEIKEKHDYLKQATRRGSLVLRWQDERMSFLEGLISRGDERIGRVIERAFLLGCRFDGWTEMFQFDRWEEAIRAEGITTDDYLAERSDRSPLPWRMVDAGVSEQFLLAERQKAYAGAHTDDCRLGLCQTCGACDSGAARVVLARDMLAESTTPSGGPGMPVRPGKWRVWFRKAGPSRLMTHLDLSAAMVRALTRGGVNFVFSQGFHPHPRISFAHATPVGMESREEIMDIEADVPGEDISALIDKINSCLPKGLEALKMEKLPPDARSLAQIVAGFDYEVYLAGENRAEDMEERIAHFLGSREFLITRETPEGKKQKDIRPLVLALVYLPEQGKMDISVAYGSSGSVRPQDILIQALTIPAARARLARVVKTKTRFQAIT